MMLRFLKGLFAVLMLLVVGGGAFAEKVADLPVPTTYVNDFAQVLTPDGHRSLEDLCLSVHRQAGAEMVVVTIKTLDDGQSIEEFVSALEDKWKIGKKGEDRSAIVVLSLAPRRLQVEIGFGLEGILNDAKVGRLIDPAVPLARSGNYDQALMTLVQGLADVIAADKGVALTPIAHTYHREGAGPQKLGMGQIVLFGIGLVIVVILALTGHLGWAFWLLLNLMGNGGGGGGGGRDDDRGGGFGGVGGGSSGGGGAGRDF
jgi:uncharacterized protein